MNDAAPQEEPRVDARVVAAHLKIKDTTVYSLVKGKRGWKDIVPLPHIPTGKTEIAPRMMFLLSEVEAWRIKTGFKPRRSGRPSTDA